MRKIRKRIVSTALVAVLALSGIPYSMTAHAEETGTQTDAEAVTQDETEKENLEEVQVGTLAVNEANFPDANFRSYLLQEYDPDGDGMINPGAVIDIQVGREYDDETTPKISSLKGIENFYRLAWIYCDNNNLTSLDVSQNPALEYLDCRYNNLTSLDVSQNPKLEHLGCSDNNLISLDVSHNPALEYLDCWTNNLASLDVSQNPALEYLDCSDNNLTSLDVSQNSALEELHCWENNLTNLDVSYNPELDVLACSENNLTSLDVSQNPALECLSCQITNLTRLDVSQNPALKELHCDDNNLTNLDVSQNPALESLTCWYNNLTSLDVSQNPALYRLECSNNNLTSLDVSQNPALKELGCGNNNLTSLDVSQNPALTELYCYNNNLTSLDVSHNSSLEYLDCYENNLTSLDVSQNPALYRLNCTYNNLTSLDLNNNTGLADLSCDYDKITGLNLSNLTSLEYLGLYFQELPKNGTLDLSGLGYQVEGLNLGAINYNLEEYYESGFYVWDYENDGFFLLSINTKTLQGESSVPTVTGIYHLLQNRDGIVAGLCTEGLDKSQYEFSWYVCKDGKNWIMAQDWTAGNEWLSYRPDENGDYVLVGKARPIGGSDEDILTASSYFSYHHEICGKCQMPYEGEGGGYLIGFESYENPNQSYQYEMLVLDCTKLANGEDAWIYTTGKCGAGDGKALWTVWQPQYGYYWTLFRLYDADGNMLDEVCYGFQNI